MCHLPSEHKVGPRQIRIAFWGVCGSLFLHGVLVGFAWLIQNWLAAPWFVWNKIPQKQFISQQFYPVFVSSSSRPERAELTETLLQKKEAASSQETTDTGKKFHAKAKPLLTPEQLPLHTVPSLLKRSEEGIALQIQLDVRAIRRWKYIKNLQSFLESLVDVEILAQKTKFRNAREMLNTFLQKADALLINSTDPTDPDAVAFFVAYPPTIPPFVPLGEGANFTSSGKPIYPPPPHISSSPAEKEPNPLWGYVLEPGFLVASSRPQWKEEVAQLQKHNFQRLHKTLLLSTEMLFLQVYNPKEHWLFYILQPAYAVTATEVQVSLLAREEISFHTRWVFGTEDKARFFVEYILPVLRGQERGIHSFADRLQYKAQWQALNALFPGLADVVSTMKISLLGKVVECSGKISSEMIENIFTGFHTLLELKNVTITRKL